MALTNGQQAELMFASMTFIAVGGASIPIGAPWPVSLALEICGIAGVTLKEALGTK